MIHEGLVEMSSSMHMYLTAQDVCHSSLILSSDSEKRLKGQSRQKASDPCMLVLTDAKYSFVRFVLVLGYIGIYHM